ncbi:U6 snRNA-associated Sm-like protein LSm3 isoform X1 [Lagopus leucura]|uniref:U6 snRNA-associated Sm-like protein LSm3 isoform X1 n=1 Tax=Lagopus leucura TaxID=30410 RepID=UPI001C68340C|nr:U6 snRNA-associated Sm-like protein LSm3 isoform X1 [Lagopus leucura]
MTESSEAGCTDVSPSGTNFCVILLDYGTVLRKRTSFPCVNWASNSFGNTKAYDQHLNMILGDVEETVTTIEIDEETYEEIYKSTKRNIPMLFVRGDGVVLVAPPLRVG